MTHSSDLTPAYITSDANVVVADLPQGVVAYGSAGKVVGVSDPFYPLVTLLMHMNGADASTTFTDDSRRVHTVTPYGDAQLDTANFKYGSAAALFDGTGDYLDIPYVTGDFDWYSEDYTIEMWVYAASWSTWQGTGSAPNLIGRMDYNGASLYWAFGPVSSGKVQLFYYNGSNQSVESVGTIPNDEWVHIAMTHVEGTGIKLFLNGTLDGSAAVSGSPQSATYPLVIGISNNNEILGAVDDIRITKGIARYTADFTPPTRQFADS